MRFHGQMNKEPILQTLASKVLSLRNHWDNHFFGLERFVSYKEKEMMGDEEWCIRQPNYITIRWLHLNSILQTLQRKLPCRALAKCIHSVHYTLIFTRCGMKSFAILTSRLDNGSEISTINSKSTRNDWTQCPRSKTSKLKCYTMECSAILLFPNANRQSFVAVTCAGGRKYLKSIENHAWPSTKCPRWEHARRDRFEALWESGNLDLVHFAAEQKDLELKFLARKTFLVSWKMF